MTTLAREPATGISARAAGTITASGFGCLLLSTALASTAFISLPLLLIWIAALGAALGRRP
ncbi:hypothetical protein ABT144_32830 [Streptomyces sp. NPDC002039]|uniref:hypothetical protein n=1 Tax=unclassified Streptomyces TaxID=2593676 RepID=UPI00331D0A2F